MRKYRSFKAIMLTLLVLFNVVVCPIQDMTNQVHAAATVEVDKSAGLVEASWPAESQYYAYNLADGSAVSDIYEAYNPGTDLVSASTPVKNLTGPLPSVYVASDSTTAFFRFRLDQDPRNSSAGGFGTSVWMLNLATEDLVNGSASFGKFTHTLTIGLDGKSPSSDYIYITNLGGSVV